MSNIKAGDVELYSLKELRSKNQPLYELSLGWIKSMRRKINGENGESFVKWILVNIERNEPFDTYVLFYRKKEEVIAIGSIVPDDQNTGKFHKLKGIWIGGINVKNNYRGKGVGNILVRNIVDLIHNYTIKIRTDIKINLFSNNPIAIHIYRKYGFKRNNKVTVYHNREKNYVYSMIMKYNFL